VTDGQVRGTGQFETLKVGVVFRSVGYQALCLPDIPFDGTKSVIPHNRGRVLDDTGQSTGKEYVSGWAKRGPSGTVGTNRSDSAETVCSLLEDLAVRKGQDGRDPDQILTLLNSRGVNYINWENWLR